MRNFAILGSLALVAFLTSGCTGTAVAVIDEKISSAVDMECSTVLLMTGEGYCRERTLEVKSEKLYCYRSIGGIDCYAQPDPYDISSTGRVPTPSPLQSPETPLVQEEKVAETPNTPAEPQPPSPPRI